MGSSEKVRSNITDMTVGSPIRHILIFTGPLVVGNIFQQFYNMVDSVVVGKFVGKNALAAVGACGSINFLFFSFCFGLANAVGVITSQYFGAKDHRQVRKTIANSYYVLILTSLIVTIISFTLAPAILRLLNTPDAIIEDAVIYMRTTCTGILGISLYNGIAAVLRALGDSKSPLYFLIFSSILNVILDLLFVITFSWGVFGVALATILSQYLSAIVAYIYAVKTNKYFVCSREERARDSSIIRKTFHLGIPLSLQSGMIAASCVVLQGAVNSFGENVVAAFTITSRIEMIVHQPYGSMGTALMTFAGQNLGAKKLDRIKKGFWQTSFVTLLFSVLMIPVMYLFGEQISAIFVNDPEVIAISAKALRITCWFYFFLGMIYVPRAMLNGCGDAGFALVNGISEVFCRVFFSWFFLYTSFFGFWSVWVTTALTWTITCFACMGRYFQGKWKNKVEKPEL